MSSRVFFLIVVVLSFVGPDPALAQVPEDSQGIHRELEDIAQLFIEQGELSKALEVYDELRGSTPNDLDLLDMTIDLCRKIPSCKGRLNGLLNELVTYVQRNPKSTRAREMLVNYALELKQFKKAQKAIEGLVKAAPDALANWLLLADHHEETRQFRKLDRLLGRLVKRFPKSSDVWLRIADRAMAVNKNTRARFALARAKILLKAKDALLRKRHMALEKEFKRSLYEARQALYRDFRQDVRWADLEDDFDHSTYP